MSDTVEIMKLAAIEKMSAESGLSMQDTWNAILAGGNARERFLNYIKIGALAVAEMAR